MTMAEGDLAVAEIRFVQGQYLPPQPAPMRMTGAIGWVRANLLSTSWRWWCGSSTASSTS